MRDEAAQLLLLLLQTDHLVTSALQCCGVDGLIAEYEHLFPSHLTTMPLSLPLTAPLRFSFALDDIITGRRSIETRIP